MAFEYRRASQKNAGARCPEYFQS